MLGRLRRVPRAHRAERRQLSVCRRPVGDRPFAAGALSQRGWHDGIVTDPNAKTTATLRTSEGDIRLILFPDQAPKTVANFLGLATGEVVLPAQRERRRQWAVLRRLHLHRVISGFMIQGGDPTGTGRGGPPVRRRDPPGSAVRPPYLLAMANAGPGTNGSQFFITVVATPHLNRRHTIFGEVADAESRAVVDAIATTATDRADRPLTDVVVQRIEQSD